jgi:thioredoxin reductase (NADPH)
MTETPVSRSEGDPKNKENRMDHIDILIIGQGPAGLSAAIYAGRAGMNTRILGCNPKVAGDYTIDNYFGFPEPVTGKELIERGVRQARKFGVDLRCERVLGIHADAGGYRVRTEAGDIDAPAVILATGVSRVRPGIRNISDYEGQGVSYCVSCDGFFHRGKRVMVLGEGIFAANQALELLQYTPHVTICTQGKPLDMTPAFIEKLREAGIGVLETKVVSLQGKGELEGVVFDDDNRQAVAGLFVAMGQASASDFALSLGLIRNGEFIEVDRRQQTNLPGIFAAGDCVGRFLQISVAVGEGALAARSAIGHAKKARKALSP